MTKPASERAAAARLVVKYQQGFTAIAGRSVYVRVAQGQARPRYVHSSQSAKEAIYSANVKFSTLKRNSIRDGSATIGPRSAAMPKASARRMMCRTTTEGAVTKLDPKAPAKGRKKSGRGRPKQSDDGVKARGRLLDAAELLFAERGFYGVTTRQVADAASVDVALIYYHFKSKSSLFDGVFERRARPLVSARRDSLRAYVVNSTVITVEGAIAAFINPMINLSLHGEAGWKSYFALVAQIDNTPWGGEIIHRYFDDNVLELIDILQTALPGSPKKELYWAYNFLAGSMMLALSGTERVDRLSKGLCRAKDLEAVRLRLLNYCAGGFLAMITAERLSGRA
jgi:AcrR family transcriptional regulator